ncbi:metabotropic glutamate receptor 8-like [Ylistrum balloti]|uniref:metabotropic glutamate receptor 8-like n=1 Tax=Ylistrum balloti TaxID=509963 RepID=UPI002905804E|nr:metabotropic glutamate receptor 8-like [Ylistrum balloti]
MENAKINCAIVLLLCFSVIHQHVSALDKGKLQVDGDIIFGGLFPMHEKGQQGNSCGKIKKEKGIQRLEAMLFAVDKINKDDELLPGLNLGLHVLDTCSSDTYALEQCMDFIKAQLTTIDITDYHCDNGSTPKYTPVKPVAGVIGAASSTVSIMVANILRLFKIPQISYASTSVDLSDKSRFEYFSRVVPPDSFQAQAMVDIAKSFGWTYVSTLADEGNYGAKGIGAFAEISKHHDICIAQRLSISRDSTDEDFDTTVMKLIGNDRAKAVVMFVNEDNSKRLLQALMRSNRSDTLWFLASDSWGAKVHPVFGQEVAAVDAVTILPKRHVIEEFDDYFLNLSPKHNKKNPWFAEYWETIFNCSISRDSKTRKRCSGKENLRSLSVGYEQEGLVQFVIDSVYALAYALHELLADKCKGQYKHCNLSGKEILAYIRNVTFQGISGDTVRFNEKGDGLGKYDIYQYQARDDGRFEYVLIGDWTDSLKLNTSLIKWSKETGELPKSVCSDPCPFGSTKLEKGESCCWACIQCADNEYLEDEFTCTECPEGFHPNVNKTTCVRLPVLHLEWDSLWVILPIVFSSFGIVCTILVVAVFIRYNSTPVIMASGRELCYVLLIGISMAYGTSLIMLIRPSIVLCTLRRLGLGVSLCLIYAAMLTKTNRIYRIFNNGIKAMVKRPSYTSPRSQIFICMSMVSVQIVGGLTWLGFEKPATTYDFQQSTFLVLKCRASQIAIIVSLMYNILLIIICTVYGIKTRKIPQNYNEAKCIAFTMYSTCIVWLAFIPIYFGASSDFKIEVTSLCMCVSISATVALVCLFAPKMYIVLLQPHKNVRKGASCASNKPSLSSRPCYDRQNSFGSFPLPLPNGGMFTNPVPVAPPNTQMTQTTFNDVFNDSFDDLSCDEITAMNNNEEQQMEADI